MGCGCRSIRMTRTAGRHNRSVGRALLPVREPRLRTRRARRPCGLTVLNDHGVWVLAVAVLQQAVADLHSAIPEYRRSAAAFIARREDFEVLVRARRTRRGCGARGGSVSGIRITKRPPKYFSL